MGTDTHTGSTSLKNGDGHSCSYTGSKSLKNGDGHSRSYTGSTSLKNGDRRSRSHRVNQSEEQGTFEAALATEHRISGWNHIKFGISGKHSGN